MFGFNAFSCWKTNINMVQYPYTSDNKYISLDLSHCYTEMASISHLWWAIAIRVNNKVLVTRKNILKINS